LRSKDGAEHPQDAESDVVCCGDQEVGTGENVEVGAQHQAKNSEKDRGRHAELQQQYAESVREKWLLHS